MPVLNAEAPLNRIARMGAAFAGSDLARAAIGLVTALVIARGLGPRDFGVWAFAMAWASTLTVAFDLGFGVLLTREAARAMSGVGRLTGGAIAARLLPFVPAALLMCILSGHLGIAGGEPDAIAAAVLLAAAGLIYGCFAAVFRAWPAWLVPILVLETIGAIALCAGATIVIARGGRVVDLLLVAAGLQGIQTAVALALWRRAAPSERMVWPSLGTALRLIGRAWPFALSGVMANAQSRVAPLMLGYLSGAGEVATFSAAWRIGSAARILPHAGLSAALPVFAHEIPRGAPEPAHARFHRVLVGFAVVMAAGLALGARPIIAIAYGRAFAAASRPLVWIAIGLVPALANSSRKVVLYASGAERVAVRWSALALGIQIAGCALLVPAFGARGAAIALAAGEATVWWPLRRDLNAGADRRSFGGGGRQPARTCS